MIPALSTSARIPPPLRLTTTPEKRLGAGKTHVQQPLTFGQRFEASPYRGKISGALIGLLSPLLVLGAGCAADPINPEADSTPISSIDPTESSIEGIWEGEVVTPSPQPLSPLSHSESSLPSPNPANPTIDDVPDWLNESQAAPSPPTQTTAPTTPNLPESQAPQPSEPAQPTQSPQAPSTGSPRQYLKIMSQNVWNASLPVARNNWIQRAHLLTDIYKSNDRDILATQETSHRQYKLLKKLAGKNFKTYPAQYSTHNRVSEQTIFYQARANGKPLWQAKHGGSINTPGRDHGLRAFPWVHLVNAQSGQEVAVLSVHALSHGNPGDPGGGLAREKAGHAMADWAQAMKKRFPDALVVAAGDINQMDKLRSKDHAIHGNRARSIPCIVGKELRGADDTQANRKGACPPSKQRIDQVFSNAPDVKGFHYVRRGQSDHSGLLANLQLIG